MKNATHWILYVAALPWNLTVAWPAILLIRLFWGKELRWETPPEGAGGPVLTCELRAGSWPAETWYVHHVVDGVKRTWGGTTLGHAIFYGVDIRRAGEWVHIQKHEHVHVEQYEGHCVAAFVVSLIVWIVLAALGHFTAAFVTWICLWWSCSYLVSFGANWLTAFLRGENFYRGSSHEESAYSQAEH